MSRSNNESRIMLTDKKIVILAEDGFEDSEMIEPIRALKALKAKVVVVGSGSSNTYRGKRGRYVAKPDTTADKVKTEDFDAIIIPGGQAPDKMRLHQSMIDLVKAANDSGKIIAAICHGPQLLISADVVRERSVTSWPSIAIDLTNAGAKWVEKAVCQDGNLITSRKPADLPRFNKAIVDALRN